MTTPVETPAPPKKRISGAWYALVTVPWIVAIAVWYVHLPRVIASFADLGETTFQSHVITSDETAFLKDGLDHVTLRPGENIIYVEGVRVGDSTAPRTELTCVLSDATGRSIPLERDTTTTMTVNWSRYASQYSVHIDEYGTYGVSCSAGMSARYSIGRGFPLFSIGLLVLSLVLALPLTGVIGFLVNRVRNPKKPKVPASLPNRAI